MALHLESKFPAMYRLYRNLSSREAPPTALEVLIAAASDKISESDINTHLKSLEAGTHSTLQGAFDKQTAVSCCKDNCFFSN